MLFSLLLQKYFWYYIFLFNIGWNIFTDIIMGIVFMVQQKVQKITESIWFKMSTFLFGLVITMASSWAIYNIDKLDTAIKTMQEDKIQLIDRIDFIDKSRQKDITEVKTLINQINTTLEKFIAKTEANDFSAREGLEVWKEIATVKQQIISMQKEIDGVNNRSK